LNVGPPKAASGGGGITPPAGDLGGSTGTPTVVATHLSSALPVAQGGTAAATAAAALASLGAPAIAGDLGGTSAAPTVTGTHLGSPLPVAQGGTAAATAAAALTALGAAPQVTPVNTQAGTSYTFVLGDAETIILASAATASTFTIPTNANVAFPVGTILQLIQTGAGKASFAGAGGVTVSGPGGLLGTRAQNSTISAVQTAANTWIVMGDLA
jgi:hypothetical protein